MLLPAVSACLHARAAQGVLPQGRCRCAGLVYAGAGRFTGRWAFTVSGLGGGD